MRIGVDYYPEHWDKELWQSDAELMAETGVNIVRLAEFAWSRLEPQEGYFDFAWLDEAIDMLSRQGMKIVLCTPTSCPPLWLYEKHPEIIQTAPDGRKIQTGIRGHRCINSPVFMKYAERITEEMLRRYAENPAVIAWQIDNELEAYPCCCETCVKSFREWLLRRHGTVEGINKAYGNSVWSGEYSSSDQIKPPTAYPKAWQNPSLCLDYWRFTSDCTVAYVRRLTSLIKRCCPELPVTTNTWFCENMPDFYKLFSELDFVSYDNYPPVRIPEDPEEFYSHGFHLDFMRGIKSENFWVMEQLSGLTGSWAPMAPTPRPGMLRGYALQAFAHGADTVVHFRWRTACKGAEMHWHGILDHSNIPGRRYNEFRQLCADAAKLSEIAGSRIVSKAAIMYSPETEQAFKIQPQTDGFYYFEQMKFFHAALTSLGVNADVISCGANLSGYNLVIVPSLYLADKTAEDNIRRFVNNGGTLIMTCRSAVKDENNNCIMDSLPASFKDIIGAEVTEYDPIGWSAQNIRTASGKSYKCREWCDILHLGTAQSYAVYDDSFYKEHPSVTVNSFGKGRAYYIGTVSTMEFYRDIIAEALDGLGIEFSQLPHGVEVTVRENEKYEYRLVFNNSAKNVEIFLPEEQYDLLDGVEKSRVELEPFGMAVMRKNR